MSTRVTLSRDLRLYADALDNDRGHDKSRVTTLMRIAADALESIEGDVYLWRIGETDGEQAITAVRDALEPTCSRISSPSTPRPRA